MSFVTVGSRLREGDHANEKNTPSGYYYQDFNYTTKYDGTRAMLEQQYFKNEVAGALVNEGHHAVVFQGATTSCNPALASCQTTGYSISTVYINDPWFGNGRPIKTVGGTTCTGTDRGSGASYACGNIGLASNAGGNSTAISYGTWTSFYFTKWNHQPAACDDGGWNNHWVAVLRKTSGSPLASTNANLEGASLEDHYTGDPKASLVGAPADQPYVGASWPEPSAAPTIVRSASTKLSDLEDALATAAVSNGLLERRAFKNALAGGHIRAIRSVQALAPSFPDYYLADVVGPHGFTAIAMFVRDGDGVTYAGTTALGATGVDPVLSPDTALRLAPGSGRTSTSQLVWGWSKQSQSPYLPFYKIATDGRVVYVDMAGHVFDRIDLE